MEVRKLDLIKKKDKYHGVCCWSGNKSLCAKVGTDLRRIGRIKWVDFGFAHCLFVPIRDADATVIIYAGK